MVLYCGCVYIVLWETAKFSYTFLPTMYEGFSFYTSSPAFGILNIYFFLILGIQIGIWWYLIVVLIHVFLMANDVASFNVFICHLYVLFSETSVYIFCPFSNWIICFSTIEFKKFFIYSMSKSFVTYKVCRYFIPVLASLSFFLKRFKVLHFFVVV